MMDTATEHGPIRRALEADPANLAGVSLDEYFAAQHLADHLDDMAATGHLEPLDLPTAACGLAAFRRAWAASGIAGEEQNFEHLRCAHTVWCELFNAGGVPLRQAAVALAMAALVDELAEAPQLIVLGRWPSETLDAAAKRVLRVLGTMIEPEAMFPALNAAGLLGTDWWTELQRPSPGYLDDVEPPSPAELAAALA